MLKNILDKIKNLNQKTKMFFLLNVLRIPTFRMPFRSSGAFFRTEKFTNGQGCSGTRN